MLAVIAGELAAQQHFVPVPEMHVHKPEHLLQDMVDHFCLSVCLRVICWRLVQIVHIRCIARKLARSQLGSRNRGLPQFHAAARHAVM